MPSTKRAMALNPIVDVTALKVHAPSFKQQAPSSKPQAPSNKQVTSGPEYDITKTEREKK